MPALTLQQAFELALGHHRAGRLPDAETLYRQILAGDSDHAEALHHLGVVAYQVGRHDLALEMIVRSAALQPTNPLVHCNHGNVLRSLGRHEAAIGAYREALRLDPMAAAACSNLGVALSEVGRTDEAIVEYQRSLELQPDDVGAWNNLGSALRDLGQFDPAVAAFRRAIGLRPEFAKAHNNLGNALKDAGKLDEGIAAYREALRLDPNYATAHSNLLLALHYVPDFHADAIFHEHCRWDEMHTQNMTSRSGPHAHDRDPERRLRIGYVSPNLQQHSVAVFLEGLLENHDPQQFEIFCYSDVHRPDAVTARLENIAHVWRSIVGLSDADVADVIRGDQIDLLVDLAGHTAGNRLLVFARKPAPIQVTYLGYSDTTGMSAMDYRLTDPHADPLGTADRLHREKLWRLPATFACFRPAVDSPPVAPLPAVTRGYVTFASLHALAKINEPLLERWAEILQQVPASRLMFVAAGLAEANTRQRLGNYFSTHGISPDRLEFRGRQSFQEYLALHHEVDVMLDSHPFSGHTIACHGLWMGVPVITLAGDRHSARMVASVLTNLGLPEGIAQTPEGYLPAALAMVGDLGRLADLRRTLRSRMADSPLLDSRRFAAEVEKAFRAMWKAWCRNH